MSVFWVCYVANWPPETRLLFCYSWDIAVRFSLSESAGVACRPGIVTLYLHDSLTHRVYTCRRRAADRLCRNLCVLAVGRKAQPLLNSEVLRAVIFIDVACVECVVTHQLYKVFHDTLSLARKSCMDEREETFLRF